MSEERHQMSSQCFYVHLHEQLAAKLLANKVAYNKIPICFSLWIPETTLLIRSNICRRKKNSSELCIFLVNVRNEGNWICRISPFYVQSISLEEEMWTFSHIDRLNVPDWARLNGWARQLRVKSLFVDWLAVEDNSATRFHLQLCWAKVAEFLRYWDCMF